MFDIAIFAGHQSALISSLVSASGEVHETESDVKGHADVGSGGEHYIHNEDLVYQSAQWEQERSRQQVRA